MNELLQTMWHTWTTGGWVMAAMAVLSLVMYGSAAHLLASAYRRGLTKVTDADLRNWVAAPSVAPAHSRELVRYTQDDVRSMKDIEGRFREVEALVVHDLDRRIALLNVLVIAAPLFGLLGTVLGMLLTFQAIGTGGGSASEVISKGISEALVATQTGMMIAVPGLVMATLAKRWRNEFVSFLTRLESITLRYFRPELHGMTRVFVRDKDQKLAEAPQPAPAAKPEAVLA
jgi:biopolymer transport protein ExbB